MKKTLLAFAAFAVCASVQAKIPAPVLDDAAKAKAAETAAKAAWQAKVDAYKLCQAQDRVVAHYRKTSAKSADAKPAEAKAAAADKKATSKAATPVPPTGGPATPVASAGPGSCMDPGPFAYNPPEQKPLETSGAHSPSGTAASPPSVRPESAKMAPAKKS